MLQLTGSFLWSETIRVRPRVRENMECSITVEMSRETSTRQNEGEARPNEEKENIIVLNQSV